MAEGDGSAGGDAVVLRFWAAARAAAGCEQERCSAGSVQAVLAAAVERHPALAELLPRCSYLLDGVAVASAELHTRPVRPGNTLEVLPPFAGG